MGTSTDSSEEGQREEVVIPWNCVSYEVRTELVKLLNPLSPLNGNDWRMLASKLGYTMRDIKSIECEKETYTVVLFNDYDTKPKASFNQVYKSLKEMDRDDCIQVLDTAYPVIEEGFKQRQDQLKHQLDNRHTMTGPYRSCPNNMGPCHCSMTSHPSMCCPCPQKFSGCMAANFNSVGMCGSVFHSHGHHGCGSFAGHSPSHDPQGQQMFPSHCHPSSPPHLHTYPHLAGPVNRQLVSPGLHNGQVVNRNSPSHAGAHQRPTNQVLQAHGEFPSTSDFNNYGSDPKEQFANSLLVEAELQGYGMCSVGGPGQQGCSKPSTDSADMEFEDSPVRTPQAMARAQDQHLPVKNTILPQNISPLDNSNLHSNSSSLDSDTVGGQHAVRMKVSRQYSDDSLRESISSGDKRPRHNSNGRMTWEDSSGGGFDMMRGGRNQGHSGQENINCGQFLPRGFGDVLDGSQGCHPGFKAAAGKPSNLENCNLPLHGSNECTNMYGAGALRGGEVEGVAEMVPESKTTLQNLEKLSQVPDRFKPTKDYKTVVAEQKIEATKSGNGQAEKMDSLESNSSRSSNGSGSSGKARLHMDNPHTFPMRVKVKQSVGGGMEELASMNSLSISRKSPSMPLDMKPSEFRKVWRHIKVFVTYSNDSKGHGKQVLSLCKFLEKNGFSCCADVSESAASTPSLQMSDWCRSKFREADFILVCLSQKYISDISTPPSSSSRGASNGDRQLHTRHIYELMSEEYLNNQQEPAVGATAASGSCTSRFIPLLFGDMRPDRLPGCMSGSPTYHWPQDYMDLAWMLTKPQDRIRGQRNGHVLGEHGTG